MVRVMSNVLSEDSGEEEGRFRMAEQKSARSFSGDRPFMIFYRYNVQCLFYFIYVKILSEFR